MADNTDRILALEVLAHLQLFVVLLVQRENALLHCDLACAYFLFWGRVDAVACGSEVASFVEDNLLGFCEIGQCEVGCFLQDCLLDWSEFALLGCLLPQYTVQLLILDGFLIKVDLSLHPRTAQLPPSMNALALPLLSSQVPDLLNLRVHISSTKLLTKAGIRGLMLILLTTAILGMDVLLAMLMADRPQIAFLLSVDAGKQSFCGGELRKLLH